MASVLGPFTGFLKDYRKLISCMVGLAVADAVVDLVFAVGPPWPARNTTVFFTVMFAWVLLISTFALWRKESIESLKTKITISCMLFICACIIYIFMRAMFVYDAPTSFDQEASGFVLQERIKALLRDKPGLNIKGLLADGGYDPNEIWEPWSVAVVRFVLLSTWLALFAAFSVVCSAVLIYLETNPANAIKWGDGSQPSKAAKKSAKTKPSAQ